MRDQALLSNAASSARGGQPDDLGGDIAAAAAALAVAPSPLPLATSPRGRGAGAERLLAAPREGGATHSAPGTKRAAAPSSLVGAGCAVDDEAAAVGAFDAAGAAAGRAAALVACVAAAGAAAFVGAAAFGAAF
jgi:hypothetical protein